MKLLWIYKASISLRVHNFSEGYGMCQAHTCTEQGLGCDTQGSWNGTIYRHIVLRTPHWLLGADELFFGQVQV